MKKNYKTLSVSVLTVLSACSFVHSAAADGYRNPPPTAEGIGKSGANSVWVDDASAISYNPANLAFQTNQSIVVSFTMARTENTYTPPLSPVSFESSGDWNVLPNIYYSLPVGEKWALGFGITTPYGQGLSWDGLDALLNPPATVTVPYEATAMVLDFVPAASYRISENLSVAAGIDFYFSTLELKAVNVNPFPPPPTVDSKGEGVAFAVGGNAGISWKPATGHKLGMTFKSAVDLDYEGDFEANGTNLGDFKTTLKLPNSLGLGYGVQLSESVQIEALVEWLQWSRNKTQTVETGSLGTTELVNNWGDTFTFGLGGSWQALDSLVVRAGYAFIPTPIPDETITPLLPDADRHAISFGLGYTLGAHTLDLAYTFSIYEERSAPLTGASPGIYEIDSNLVGLTYSASF